MLTAPLVYTVSHGVRVYSPCIRVTNRVSLSYYDINPSYFFVQGGGVVKIGRWLGDVFCFAGLHVMSVRMLCRRLGHGEGRQHV